MKRIFLAVAFFALALCACNEVEYSETVKATAPGVYHMCIQAAFDIPTKGVTFTGESGISSQFETGDKIYVYNETQKAFARLADDDYKLAYLQPSSISESGQSCVLEGDLTFWKWDDDGDEWEQVILGERDTCSLYYQMNDPDYVGGPNFDYTTQKGSAATASNSDFAIATGVSLSLSGDMLSVPEKVKFSNLQSIFRQHLTFSKDNQPVDPSGFSMLTIGTQNGTLVDYYFPTEEDPDEQICTGSFSIVYPVIAHDQDAFFSLAFDYSDEEDLEDDKFILTAADNEGNVYQGTKDVPSGGFLKSNYYYGSMELAWKYKKIKPNVSRTDGGDEDELEPNIFGQYDFSDASDPALVTIDGDSRDYYFYFRGNATLTLKGNGVATFLSSNEDFITSTDGNLNIALGSDYTINCASYMTAIVCQEGAIKLSTTTGSAQTLTLITCEDDTYHGLYGDKNEDFFFWDNLSDLAADGFTVTRSATIEKDGTYSRTYTITPTALVAFRGYEISHGILHRKGEKDYSLTNTGSSINPIELADYYNDEASLNHYYIQWSLLQSELGADGSNIKADSEYLPFFDETHNKRWTIPSAREWADIFYDSPKSAIKISNREGTITKTITSDPAYLPVSVVDGDNTYNGLLLLRDGSQIVSDKLSTATYGGRPFTAVGYPDNWNSVALACDYSTNSLSLAELQMLIETYSCAFVQCSGYYRSDWRYIANEGFYWARNPQSGDKGAFHFTSSNTSVDLYAGARYDEAYYHPVRLVYKY